MQLSGPAPREWVCESGAGAMTPANAADPILAGRQGVDVCGLAGPSHSAVFGKCASALMAVGKVGTFALLSMSGSLNHRNWSCQRGKQIRSPLADTDAV